MLGVPKVGGSCDIWSDFLKNVELLQTGPDPHLSKYFLATCHTDSHSCLILMSVENFTSFMSSSNCFWALSTLAFNLMNFLSFMSSAEASLSLIATVFLYALYELRNFILYLTNSLSKITCMHHGSFTKDGPTSAAAELIFSSQQYLTWPVCR